VHDLEYLFNRCEYKPHKGQLKVHIMARFNRFLGVLFGRRGGKSHCASFEAVETLFQAPHPFFGAPVGLITAPTVDLTKAVFERTHDLIFKYFKNYNPKYSRSERYIELKKLGSELYVRSGDKPKSLVSRGYSKVVIDEAGFFQDTSYRELKPALLDRTGSLVAIGVPSLKNWYFDLYKRAKRKEEDYAVIQLPSIVNPSISVKEWHNLYKTTPRLEFLRQYCAFFNEDDLNVWTVKDLDEALIDEIEDYDSNSTYYAGLDLARKQDYTVLTIVKPVDKFIKVVYSLRIQGQWKTQATRIADILNAYNVSVCVVDTTGIGDAVIELLADKTVAGLQGFIFTNESKTQLVDSFSMELEHNNILIPRLFNFYYEELKYFEYTTSKTGLRVFNAPKGYNDDCVISLLLAVRSVRFYNYV
jgi:hypothetical protein